MGDEAATVEKEAAPPTKEDEKKARASPFSEDMSPPPSPAISSPTPFNMGRISPVNLGGSRKPPRSPKRPLQSLEDALGRYQSTSERSDSEIKSILPRSPTKTIRRRSGNLSKLDLKEKESFASWSQESGEEGLKQPVKQISLGQYIWSELLTWEFEDDMNETVKRQRIYDFLQVPFNLEPLLLIGFFVVFDSFLYLFTVLPLRCMLSLIQKIWRPLRKLHPSQVCDLIRAALFFLCWFMISSVNTSVVYHWVRGQAIIKLYVIYNVFEIFDKLCCSFGQDVLDALFWTASTAKGVRGNLRALLDFSVALIYVTLHTMVTFVQVVTLNVAINSANNMLITLLISNNFVELKTSVFKRFEEENLFQISCSDIVERFQLFVYLSIISCENLRNCSYQMGFVIGIVWAFECAIDWVKYAFVTKFNKMSPGIFRKYADRICDDLTTGKLSKNAKGLLDHTHTVSRRIGFVNLPLGCLVARHLFRAITTWKIQLIVIFYACLWALKILISIMLIGHASVKRSRLRAKRSSKPGAVTPLRERLSSVERFTMVKSAIP